VLLISSENFPLTALLRTDTTRIDKACTRSLVLRPRTTEGRPIPPRTALLCPRDRGKALTGGLSGLWRYRVGGNRVVCDLQDARLIVLVIDIDHRSNSYE